MLTEKRRRELELKAKAEAFCQSIIGWHSGCSDGPIFLAKYKDVEGSVHSINIIDMTIQLNVRM